jgi:ABC-type lipoprotein release transport system permease subunit
VSKIHQQVARGDWLVASDPVGVVLGQGLARTLAVQPGDELVVLSQASDGSMANDLFEVRGILAPTGEAVDRGGVLVTEEAFRRFFVFPSGFHEIILRRPPGSPLEEFAADVRSMAPDERVETWREIAPTLASLLDSARGIMVFVFFIVYIAIGILILNAMLMAVFERIREFGVLKAIGYGPGQVFSIIFAECGVQVLLAIGVGLTLAVPGLWYLRSVGIDMGTLGGMAVMGMVLDPIWRGVIEPQVFTGPVFTLLTIVALAAVYPAGKAALLSPIRAIRHR